MRALLTLILSFMVAWQVFALDITNTLEYTGEGGTNPAYSKKIKNIMVFQPTGAAWWYDLEATNPNWESTWSLHRGRGLRNYTHPSDEGYLFRNPDVYLQQMEEIRGLSSHIAVALFIMPNDEAGSSPGTGYGAYWTPTGDWRKPKDLYHEVRWAAWKKGLQVAPFISLNDFLGKGPGSIKPALEDLVNYVMQTVDGVSLKTDDGKVVILIEGLPSQTNLSSAQKAEINQYLASRSDILWIDNLVNDCPTYSSNIYRSAAVDDFSGTIQEYLKGACSGRYLWHYTNRTAKSPGDMAYIPMVIQERWLNISPHDPSMFPIVISQWNEYSEYKVFEPTIYDAYNEYYYLQWRMTQQ